MTPIEWVVAALGTGGISTFGYNLLKARAENKKTGAEGAVLLVDSAANYAASLVGRLDQVTKEFDDYRDEQDAKWQEQRSRDAARDRRERAQDNLFRAHSRWDDRAVAELAGKGIDLPPPPPLYLGDHHDTQ